jgi:hypothetical protein
MENPATWGPAEKIVDEILGEIILNWSRPAEVKEGCPVPHLHDSHGTTDCLRKVRAAGIPVKECRL